MVVIVLGGVWGLIVASPLVRAARRQQVVVRTRGLGRRVTRDPRVTHARRSWRAVPVVATVVSVLSAPRRRRAARTERETLRRELPVAIDLCSVAVGAGYTPYAAIEVAASWCPPNAARVLASVPRQCRLGASFDATLRELAQSMPPVAPLADAIGSAARLGAPIAPTLARLASETRAELRRAAEQRARTVPIRLLFPLVFLVLPAFGLLTIAPVLLDGVARAH